MSTRGNSATRLIVAKWVFVIIQLLLSCVSYAQGADAPNYTRLFDGHWWMNADPSEKIGFLYALDDCLTYDASPKLSFNDAWTNYSRKIDNYYAPSSKNLSTFVQQIFEQFGKKQKSTAKERKDERYGEEFWRAHDEHARQGFVEGYISCRVQYKNSPKWSKPVSYYVAQLDDMYNVDDRHGEDAPEFEGSVASALMQMRDGAPPVK